MKKFLFAFLFVALSFKINASTLFLSEDGLELEGDGFSIELCNNMLSFSYKGFSYGDLSRRGFFRFIENPHSYSAVDLRPVSKPFSKSDAKSGFVFSFDCFDLFFSMSSGPLVGFSFDKNKLSLLYMFAAKRGANRGLQQSFMDITDRSFMAVAGAYDMSFITFFAIASIDEYGNIESLFGANSSFKCFSFGFKYGNIHPIENRNGYDIFSINAHIRLDKLNVSWKIMLGKRPIYSYEFQKKKLEKEVSICFGTLLVKADYSYCFDANGKMSNSVSLSAESEFLRFGYGSDSGLFSKLKHEYGSIMFSKDEVVVSLCLSSKGKDSSFALSFSTKKRFEVEATIVF